MHVVLLESYYGGSHKSWADGYRRFSAHDVRLLTMPAQFWKWRMQGAAITFARLLDEKPDVILASSMIDLSIFRALTQRRLGAVPIALYFHENQLSYPQNQRQRHGWRYGFINFVSALCADANFFNSAFHRQDFMQQLPRLLKHFADYNELQSIAQIESKSSVLPLGMDLRRFDAYKTGKAARHSPLILWNHRWEADKNPDEFIASLLQLQSAGCDFKVAITGERFGKVPPAFQSAASQLGERLVQFGHLDSFADYAALLWQADYVVSTARQEFFGAAVCEAMYCGCIPILPKRLNYPFLLPADLHAKCLFKDGKLSALLGHHLAGRIQVDTTALQAKIAAFDWSLAAPQLDQALQNLVR